MATLDECRRALDRLAGNLGGSGADGTNQVALDRTLSCRVTDLATTFHGELREGHLAGITTEERPKAQVRLSTTSDDLVALTAGQLSFGKAWATGRLKVEASLRDLMRLRSLL